MLHYAAVLLFLAAPTSDHFNPNAPGDTLRDSTFIVSPGSHFIWDAWETDDVGIAQVLIDDGPSSPHISQRTRIAERREIPNPADPNGPTVKFVLKQYILDVSSAAPNETVATVQCTGRQADNPAWTFQFSLHVRT